MFVASRCKILANIHYTNFLQCLLGSKCNSTMGLLACRWLHQLRITLRMCQGQRRCYSHDLLGLHINLQLHTTNNRPAISGRWHFYKLNNTTRKIWGKFLREVSPRPFCTSSTSTWWYTSISVSWNLTRSDTTALKNVTRNQWNW